MRRIAKRSMKAGLPPGTLVHVGKVRTDKVKITLIDYTQSTYTEKLLDNVEDSFPFADKESVTWINIDGIHDLKLIADVGKHFSLHPLLQEDIVNTEKRPKQEDYGDYIYVIIKMLSIENSEIQSEQLSLVVGKNWVISFQEESGDVFGPIRERLRQGKGKLRSEGSDYLAYALIDAVVDSNFVILEAMEERINRVEEKLVANPAQKTLHDLHRLKQDLIFLHRSIWPLREVLSGLGRSEIGILKESTKLYLRDVYEHVIEAIDTLEIYREIISSMFDIYLSSMNNRLQEIMKVLTIISTIFIPLMFLASIYGMNFHDMPELAWRWSYPVLLVIMAIIVVLMLRYFRGKKWV